MSVRRFLGMVPEYSLEQRIQILASSTAVLVTGVAISLGTFLNQEPVLLIFGFCMVVVMTIINYYSRKPGNRFSTYALLVAIARVGAPPAAQLLGKAGGLACMQPVSNVHATSK